MGARAHRPSSSSLHAACHEGAGPYTWGERSRQLAGCYRRINRSPRCSKISRKVFKKLCPFVGGNSQPIADHLLNGGVPSISAQSGGRDYHSKIVALLASPGHDISIWPVRQIALLRGCCAERCDGECKGTKQQGPSSHQTASLFSRVEEACSHDIRPEGSRLESLETARKSAEPSPRP